MHSFVQLSLLEKGIFEDGGFSSYVVIAPNKYVQPLVKLGLLSECGSSDKGTFLSPTEKGGNTFMLARESGFISGEKPWIID